MVKGFHAGKGVASALVLSLVLVACGGGGGSDDSAPAATPSSSAPSSASSSSAPAASSSSSSEASSSQASSSATSSSESSSSESSSSAPASTEWKPTYAALSSLVAGTSEPAVNTNTNFNATSAPVTAAGFEFRSPSAGQLRLYRNEAGDEYAVNYNGESVSSLGAAGTVVSLPASFRYMAIPSVSNGATVSVSFTYTNSASCTTACEASRIALVDASGNVLSSKVIYTQDPAKDTISATATSTGKIYVLFSRNGGSGGGIRIWSVTQ